MSEKKIVVRNSKKKLIKVVQAQNKNLLQNQKVVDLPNIKLKKKIKKCECRTPKSVV